MSIDAVRAQMQRMSRPRENPAWATKAIAQSFEKLEQQIDPTWLPVMDDVRARGDAVVGKLNELGCGAYGCVYRTLDPTIVLKLTTDATEAEFAHELADTLSTPICVKYHRVVAPHAHHQRRQIYFLWREEAKKVGGIYKEKGYGRRARTLIHVQHLAAQQAYELMRHRMKAYRSIEEALEVWRQATREMAQLPELAFLGNGLLEVLERQKIFFGDIHEGNLGLCERNGALTWVITDPGHVAVVDW